MNKIKKFHDIKRMSDILLINVEIISEGNDLNLIDCHKVFRRVGNKTIYILPREVLGNLKIENMSLKDTYNKFAEEYAKDHEEDIWWIDGADKFISMLGAGAVILDVGCGTGIKTKYLVGKGFKVTGFYFAENLIELAKERVPEAVFIVDDIFNLSRIKGKFDGIFAQAVILHIPKKDVATVLKKLSKRLKNGGYLYLGLKEKERGGKDEDVKIENKYGYKYERFFSYFTMDEIKSHLENLGMEICYENFTSSGKAPWIQIIGKKLR